MSAADGHFASLPSPSRPEVPLASMGPGFIARAILTLLDLRRDRDLPRAFGRPREAASECCVAAAQGRRAISERLPEKSATPCARARGDTHQQPGRAVPRRAMMVDRSMVQRTSP